MISVSVSGGKKVFELDFPDWGRKTNWSAGEQCCNSDHACAELVSSRAPSRIFFSNSDFRGHQPQAGGRVGDQGGAAGGPLHRER